MGPGVALEHLHNFPLGSIKYSDSESDSEYFITEIRY